MPSPGISYYGYPLGILGLHSMYPKPVGHMRNARTFPFPILEKVVEGVSPIDLAQQTIPDACIEKVIAAAMDLQQQNVQAIIGSCGYLLPLQERICSRLKIPFLASSLLLLPMLRLIHGHTAKIGILAASSGYYTDFDWNTVGMCRDSIIVKGLPDEAYLWKMIRGNGSIPFDAEKIRSEVLSLADELQGKCDTVVIECTDLSVFATEIASKLHLAVYDINAAIEFLYVSACRHV